MSTFLLASAGFWLGLFVGVGGSWLATHPDRRSALWSRVRELFHKS
jgi:hypothetical protein